MRLGSRGASIVAVIIMLAIVTLLGTVFVALFTGSLERSTGAALSARALYSAEGGLEAAIGHLKEAPASLYWTWRDGYLGKPAGSGTVDVEVLEYENRDSTLAASVKCEPFESTITAAGANPSRTVYMALSWGTSNNMGLELYDNTIADCSNPLASANLLASSVTSNMPEIIRYRVTDAAPATLTYTARVSGTTGDVYQLRISHPDEAAFGTGKTCGQPAGPPFKKCMRAVISLGKAQNARREVFAGFSK
ncbi:MAG: hypothetical protein HY891_09700 [Deltaproteobacteria bacterium]|nr:hypothetical protein [Deltaproteobacteria bacterium]